jgi:spermidine/putrescine-binding protein
VSITEGRLNRSNLLKAGAAGAVGLALPARALARTVTIDGTTLNMLTWSDHYANDQLKAVNKSTQIQGRPTLFSDNADAYLKIKHTGSQFDIVSGDALWVPKYRKDGLTLPFSL